MRKCVKKVVPPCSKPNDGFVSLSEYSIDIVGETKTFKECCLAIMNQHNIIDGKYHDEFEEVSRRGYVSYGDIMYIIRTWTVKDHPNGFTIYYSLFTKPLSEYTN
jgi:hypothetical protein